MTRKTRLITSQLALLVGATVSLASMGLAGRQPAPRKLILTATLRPAQVLVAPTLTAPDARATFKATVDLHYRGGNGHAIWPRMRATHLTSPITAVHIHRGGAGVSGAAIATICERRSELSPPCDALGQGFFNWTAAPRFDALLRGRAYVDVHTVRNPKGELRGQLVIRPTTR